MYCTIQRAVSSTASLSPDARGALQRLSRHAETLAGLSAGFMAPALAVADCFGAALGDGSNESWTSFVVAADIVVRHTANIASIIPLSAREREAYLFFAEIVRENEDLLATGAFANA